MKSTRSKITFRASKEDYKEKQRQPYCVKFVEKLFATALKSKGMKNLQDV